MKKAQQKSVPSLSSFGSATKKLFIKTWGCQMNVYDSTRMADLLAPLGYRTVDEADDADMVILNTCHIREKAAEKVYSDLGRLRLQKEEKAQKGERMILAVAGCVAQAEGQEILTRAPYVDMVFGPQSYQGLPEMVGKAARAAGEKILDTDFPVESKFDRLPEEQAGQGISAFLAVQEGCDKFCTFCVVPYTRGAEFSRPAAQILDEARRLIAAGAREITFLGQNVNAWHGEGLDGKTWGLGRLIREIASWGILDRIRYTTSHPRDMDDDLISAHGEVPSLMPYLHLPIQSGSDRILSAMNRKHTVDDYRRIIDKLMTAQPSLALSSDFIVGFPGETDADFQATADVVKQVGYAQAYSFKYSPRPGTPASGLQNQVSEDVKSDRLTALQDVIMAQQKNFNRRFLNQTLPVLLDRKGKQESQLHGRSPWMQSVHVTAPDRLLGTVVQVNIESVSSSSLTGVVATGEYASTTELNRP